MIRNVSNLNFSILRLIQPLFILCIALVSISVSGQSDIKSNIWFEEIAIPCSRPKDGNYIITDEKGYKEICRGVITIGKKPSFDFSEYVLLGIFETVSFCHQPTIDFELLKNDELKTIRFIVKVGEKGSCRINKSLSIQKWIAIERPSNDYKIIFNN